MEKRYEKAMHDANELADRILSGHAPEMVPEFNLRRQHAERLNVQKNWMLFMMRVHRRRIYAAVSAAAALIALALFVFTPDGKSGMERPAGMAEQIDLMPAREHVVLTLADGRTVLLDSVGGGTRLQDGANVDARHGSIVYDQDSRQGDKISEYNELHVPRGRSYMLTLGDGTRVWLNAMSRLKYPVSFDRDHRKVVLSGEAYFEVARNEQAPFSVETADYTVRVLGTSFNVSAYADDRTTVTTLVSGSVQIAGAGPACRMEPGEQYVYDRADGAYALCRVDAELYTSWVGNVLRIEDQPLSEIFRVLERRYDIDVVFDDRRVAGVEFSGKLPLDDNLNVVIQQLARVSNVEFTMDGRVVRVGSLSGAAK